MTTAAGRRSAPTAASTHSIAPFALVTASLTGDTVTAFDATRAWAEFEQLLRARYGYFKRPGVDGDSILGYFEPAAKRAKTKKDFIDILQVVAHNFADPHFIVGPFDPTDYSIIPTSADLFAQYRSGEVSLVDVRQDSDAQAQGLRPGATILSIDGRSPTAAIERLMGRPISSLSTTQINTGLNIALAGIRNQPRRVQIKSQPANQTYTLRPTAELVKQLRSDSLLRVGRQGDVSIIRFNNSLGNNQTISAFRTALLGVQDTRLLMLDFRNTPSGGNTTVARSIMGHFVEQEMPYQVHMVPSEERLFGVPRKFVEYVLPIRPFYRGRVVALGGYWTGSMGEGLLIGFDAIGAKTAGAGLADLLGALFNETLATSSAKVDLGEEMLFHINGQPRESFVPAIYLEAPEGRAGHDPLVELVISTLR
ncbi:hypothetical protein [Spirosoma rhododendri]|uniref:Peptidase S41 n=1 Tax=Spirosoma rhododendri TaxID=2728024 RepID=A0A7L5DTC0_9BACT|nr:hypothetical protein [Spirosoma rhododendri]QJD81666.1 hypothetical protein HH216_25330 [Spirosoma rhododendri]